MTKPLLTALGFILAGSGLLSLVYQIIGLKLSWLVWIDSFGGLNGLAIRLAFIFGGIVLIYVTRTDMDV